MVYEWRTGSCIKADPQKSGEMFELLAQTEAGLTAETLLDANRPKGTPLHEDYEWDNDLAAESWRLYQSRHFLNSLTVCIFSDKSSAEVQTRAVHITTDAHKYEPISLIVQQKDKYAASGSRKGNRRCADSRTRSARPPAHGRHAPSRRSNAPCLR